MLGDGDSTLTYFSRWKSGHNFEFLRWSPVSLTATALPEPSSLALLMPLCSHGILRCHRASRGMKGIS